MLIILFTAISMLKAFGDDTDCLYNNNECSSTNQMQKEQEKQKFLRDLDMRLQLWNALNCSKRDICTPVGNTTWDCDPNDEAFNITGHCDPDWNDSGIENQAYPASNMYACFDRADDFADFINNVLHGDTTGYTVQYPCPPFQPPHQEDESGK
jgi:hypothetical protein